MKVLFVFNHPAPYKINFFNLLGQHCELTVLFERQSNKDRNKLFYSETAKNFHAITIKGLHLGKENHLSWGIKKHLKTHSYDLVVMNGYSTISEMIAINYLKKHHLPYAFYINGGIIKKESHLKYLFKKHFILGAKYYFSPSPVADKYLEHYSVSPQIIHHYPYSTIFQSQIAPFMTNEEKSSLASSLGLPSAPLYFSVGQFIKRKGFMDLISFWRNVPQESQLVLIGSGPEKKKYERLIAQYRLTNITILPFLKKETLLHYLRAGTGFIFFSYEDIYGHVINEALSQGLPVISTKGVVAAEHLIKDGENGFLVDRINHEKILEAIIFLQKHNLSQNAIKTAEENTLEIMASVHYKIFKEVVTK